MTTTSPIELLERRTLLSTPQLLGDLNQIPAPGHGPKDPTALDANRVIFGAGDRMHGSELWLHDFSTGQTSVVKEICPGRTGSDPSMFTTVNGVAYFMATDPVNGRELWKTDGTPNGTQLVKNIEPGSDSISVYEMYAAGPFLYFAAESSANGTELWRSDGTAAGTTLIRDIVSGPNGSTPRDLTSVGSILFFTSETSLGRELWKSNGTAAGTVLVRDIYSGSEGSEPRDLAVLGSTLIFSAEHPTSGRELWRSDGTVGGTSLLKDIGAGESSGYPRGMTSVGNKVFFDAWMSGAGREIWTTDGTALGTAIVAEQIPGENFSGFDQITRHGTGIVCVLESTQSGALYRSDGTPGGTGILQSIPNSVVTVRGTAGGNAYFSDTRPTGNFNYALWRTDGTVSGTEIVRSYEANHFFPLHNFAAVGARAVFTAADFTYGESLWQSNGTVAGTTLVVDPNPATEGLEPRRAFPSASGLTYLLGGQGFTGGDLVVTDGTPDGTLKLYSIDYSIDLSDRDWLCDVNGTLFFLDYPNHVGKELWKTDGTTAGTVLVKQFTAVEDLTEISNFVSFNGMLYFGAYDTAHGYELWRSDGTEAGTVRVTDTLPGPDSVGVSNLSVVGDKMFFSGYLPGTGLELWSSDGTDAGTHLVKDLNPGAENSNPELMVDLNGVVLFVAEDAQHGLELWRSDGTPDGTYLVRDISNGDSILFPFLRQRMWTRVGDELIFRANTAEAGEELWRTDGTFDGTTLLCDLVPGTLGANLINWSQVGGSLIVTMYDPADPDGYTLNLMSIDLATSTSTIVQSFVAPANNFFGTTVTANGIAYFESNTTATGSELWETDGTPSGTRLVADLLPGDGSSYPIHLFAADRYLAFGADNGVTGTEAWALADDHAPRVWRSEFQPDARAGASLLFYLTEDVTSSFGPDDLQVRNLTNGTILTPPQFSAVFDSARRAVVVSLAPSVSDGNYAVVLNRAGVTDASGNQLAADEQHLFFVLAGDANRDRAINISDFAILAARFNMPGVFSQGDFNYDGVTNISDFAILAAKFNTSLPQASGFNRSPLASRAADENVLNLAGLRNTLWDSEPADDELLSGLSN